MDVYMKPGDRVRIKSFNEIKENHPKDLEIYGSRINGLFFLIRLEKFCGSIVTLTTFKHKNTGIIWKIEDGKNKDTFGIIKNTWWWHEKWLEPTDFLTDEDFDI